MKKYFFGMIIIILIIIGSILGLAFNVLNDSSSVATTTEEGCTPVTVYALKEEALKKASLVLTPEVKTKYYKITFPPNTYVAGKKEDGSLDIILTQEDGNLGRKIIADGGEIFMWSPDGIEKKICL
jgi:uncharacterized protein YpmB